MESAPHISSSSDASPQQPETATSSAPSASTTPSQNPPLRQPQFEWKQSIQPPSWPASRSRTPFSHFAHHIPSSSLAPALGTSASAATASDSPASSLPSPWTQTTTTPRIGGLPVGLTAQGPHFSWHQRPSMSFSPFGPSQAFSQPFNSLPRVFHQSPTATAQRRPPTGRIQQNGMMGSSNIAMQMQQCGPSGPPQQRFGQPILRSISSSTTETSQNFPGPTLLGCPSMVYPTFSSLVPQQQISSQGMQMHVPTVPSSSYSPQERPHVCQQRPSQPQQHSLSTTSRRRRPKTPSLRQKHQQQKSHQPFQLRQQLEQQQQVLTQLQKHNTNQQNISLRNQEALAQQQLHQPSGTTANRPKSPALVQSGLAQSGPVVPAVNVDAAEPDNHVISKKSIHELLNQIDPSEKLDVGVEEVLMDIAEDFIESVTTSACSLAKHRKSTILESKDILLHVEKCWNMTLPGYGEDEIKGFKKQKTNDIHKERLTMIKKSMVAMGDAGKIRKPNARKRASNLKALIHPLKSKTHL